MADFSKPTSGETASDNAGIKPHTSAGRQSSWEAHDAYWRDNYGTRPYAKADRSYDYYEPAYKYGHESAFLYGGRAWDEEVEHDLERGWDQARGESTSTWPEVRDAVRDAYERWQSVAPR